MLALTVDHGLNPDSADWTIFAERTARDLGADWRGLNWAGPVPATGLPAAARMARHRLIAQAAREAGARVVLFAHTADDIAEAEVMRADGSTLGRLRDWSPSPAWPEGRGLMLLRPMLGAGRAEVRAWLQGQGADWIEDPGNDDLKFARSRARASLLPWGAGGSHCEATPGGREDRMRVGPARGEAASGQPTVSLSGSAPSPGSRKDDGCAALRSSPLPMGEGSLYLDRSTKAATLAAVLVCTGGGDRVPRGDRLSAILGRLQSGDDFTATLCGARIEARGDQGLVTREAGEFVRRPRPPLLLPDGVETIWDGRWAITVDSPGWFVVPAAGRMVGLSDADRAVLKALPPAARGSIPVLIRNDATAPVLAGSVGKAVALVEERLALSLDRMTHERDLGAAIHGVSPRNHLFSDAHH